MPVFFNLIGLGMLALSLGLSVLLALYIPEIGLKKIIIVSIALLFLLDTIYRVTIVRKKVLSIKRKSKNEELSILKKDLNASFPMPLTIAITNYGGSLMLLPCWGFSILIGALSYLHIS